MLKKLMSILSISLILLDEIAYSSPFEFFFKSVKRIFILICLPQSSLWNPKTLPAKISSESFFIISGCDLVNITEE